MSRLSHTLAVLARDNLNVYVLGDFLDGAKALFCVGLQGCLYPYVTLLDGLVAHRIYSRLPSHNIPDLSRFVACFAELPSL